MKIRMGYRRRHIGHLLKLMLLGLLASFLVVACRGQTDNAGKLNQPTATSSSNNCQTIDHDQGETQVCGQPQRIVVVSPYMLELLLTLGVQPVGYADHFPLPYRQFNQPSQQIPYLGEQVTSQPINIGTAFNPSLEAIAKLNPDLILGFSGNQKEYALLSQIAPTLIFPYVSDDQWQNHLRLIAKALGRSERVETIISAHEQRLDVTRKALQPIANDYPKVVVLSVNSPLGQNLDLKTYKNHCGGLLRDLGFQLVSGSSLKQTETSNIPISLETLPQLDTDSIIVLAENSDFTNPDVDPVKQQIEPAKQQWQENPITQSLKASKAGRVYFTSTYICHGLPGPIGTQLFLNELREQMLSNQ